jgi:hypothetical protein
VLIGLILDEVRAEWAGEQLYLLATRPEPGQWPPLGNEARATLTSALDTAVARDAAVACLSIGLAVERARDVLVAIVHEELDDEDAYTDADVLDYDLGCELQNVVIALREAPLSDEMLELLDRIFAGADGPLTSVCSTKLIRKGVPVEMLRRWRERLASLGYSLDGYRDARLLEIDVAIRNALGTPAQELVTELVRPEPRFFVAHAAFLCVRELTRVDLEVVLTTLDEAQRSATGPEEADRVAAIREALDF